MSSTTEFSNVHRIQSFRGAQGSTILLIKVVLLQVLRLDLLVCLDRNILAPHSTTLEVTCGETLASVS